jgi:2-amino-4-hydroxy-6-hydroxymethyldihydropteridine diphosphokinase
MYDVILLTGGNLGDRLTMLAGAREQIEKNVGPVRKASAVYETAPWGNTGQPAFLNQALAVETDLSPAAVLERILSIETGLGRKRDQKWGPRSIDIDILFYGSEVVEEKNLRIPHPEIPNRRFVLEPLREIAPEMVHPVLRQTIEALLEQTSDASEVKRLGDGM